MSQQKEKPRRLVAMSLVQILKLRTHLIAALRQTAVINWMRLTKNET